MIRLVVDTSVLHKANESTSSEYKDAVCLLLKLPEGALVYFDKENGIAGEYFKSVFGPGIQSFAFLWWQKQHSMGGVDYIAGELSAHEDEVFSRDGCDTDDRPFIAVALRANVPVVHEDGDYEEPCAQALGVGELRLAGACAALGL